MPQRDGRKCGPVGADGESRDRVQPNGRCETPNPRGDTYGPVSYLVYLPAVALLGWSGQWDALPAAHATSIGLDLLTLVGLGLVGLRLGGRRLAATLAFAWAAFPFTAYVLISTTNAELNPAPPVWGFERSPLPTAAGGNDKNAVTAVTAEAKPPPAIEILGHGEQSYFQSRFAGSREDATPSEMRSLQGMYRCDDPWIGTLRIVARRSRLWMQSSWDGPVPLLAAGPNTYRIGDPQSPGRFAAAYAARRCWWKCHTPASRRGDNRPGA